MKNSPYDKPDWYKQSTWDLKYVVPAAEKVDYIYNDLFIFENKGSECLRIKLEWNDIKEHYGKEVIPSTITDKTRINKHGFREGNLSDFCKEDKISRNNSLNGVIVDGLLVPHRQHLREAREKGRSFRNIIKKNIFTFHYKNKKDFYTRINDERVLFEVKHTL